MYERQFQPKVWEDTLSTSESSCAEGDADSVQTIEVKSGLQLEESDSPQEETAAQTRVRRKAFLDPGSPLLG